MAKKKQEMTTTQSLFAYVKEIVGALALIAFGCVLYRYSEDIAAWFGNMVQEGFNSIFGQPQN